MFTREGRSFLRGLARNPSGVGAITPSSAGLARRMLAGIDLSGGGAVLELGPGTGPITREISLRISEPSCYLGVERDGHFAQLLSERFPNLRFVNGSAESAADHVRDAGMTGLKAIISGLPFATLPNGVQDRILDSVEALMTPGVVFRTFQYLHALPLPKARRFRRRMRERFGGGTMSRPVLLNLPPAVVLSWER